MIGYLGVSNDSTMLVSMNSDNGISFESGAGTVNGEAAVLMSVSQDESEEFYNASTICVYPNQILLMHANGDTANAVTLDDDGLKYNDSPVITVDENGVVNKNEITIGSFEIKNDKPYNYTLEGKFYPYDPECAEGFNVIAHYDQEGVKYGDIIDGSQGFGPIFGWYYGFVITDILFEDLELGDDIKNKTLARFLNRNIPVLAAYIDNEYPVDGVDAVIFTNDVSEELSTLYTEDNYINDVTFTRSVPFSLKHTSKALLNGSPVITTETLAESDIVSNLNKKINKEETRAKNVEENLNNRIEAIGEDYVPYFKTANSGDGGTSLDSEIKITSEYIWPGDAQDVYSQSTICLGGDKKGRSINLRATDEDDDGNLQHNELTISAFDGVKINGSEVVVKKDFPIVKGDANNSAVLNGEYNGYSNKAISQVSIAIGAAANAGLKGYYYKAIDFTNKKIYLSESQPNSIKTSGFSAESITCAYDVGDYISVVADSKFENCSKITAKGNGVITVDSLPFTASNLPSYTLGIGKQPDDFTLYSANRSISSLTNVMTVKNYNKGTVDMGGGAHAEGIQTFATNIGSHAEGIQTHAYGQYSHTEGFKTQAGYAAHAEGRETIASGSRSHAEGHNTVASGDMSHAQGIDTVASGSRSFATGNGTIASGAQSISAGFKSKSVGDSAVSIGHKTYAKGQDSICIGTSNNEVTAYESKTNEEILAGVKDGSIVASITLGNQSQAFGGNVFAYGNQSFASGWRTKAIGNHSHAEGNYSIAEGDNSFATGDHTKTTKANEVAFGKYNNSTTNTLFSVGTGTSESARKNAFEITTDGLIYIYKKDGTRVCLQDIL